MFRSSKSTPYFLAAKRRCIVVFERRQQVRPRLIELGALRRRARVHEESIVAVIFDRCESDSARACCRYCRTVPESDHDRRVSVHGAKPRATVGRIPPPPLSTAMAGLAGLPSKSTYRRLRQPSLPRRHRRKCDNERWHPPPVWCPIPRRRTAARRSFLRDQQFGWEPRSLRRARSRPGRSSHFGGMRPSFSPSVVSASKHRTQGNDFARRLSPRVKRSRGFRQTRSPRSPAADWPMRRKARCRLFRTVGPLQIGLQARAADGFARSPSVSTAASSSSPAAAASVLCHWRSSLPKRSQAARTSASFGSTLRMVAATPATVRRSRKGETCGRAIEHVPEMLAKPHAQPLLSRELVELDVAECPAPFCGDIATPRTWREDIGRDRMAWPLRRPRCESPCGDRSP